MKLSTRRFISILLMVMMLLMQFFVVSAEDVYDGEIQWEYIPQSRELIISGEGEMPDFLSDNYPWCDYDAEILTIAGDFTSIGMGAFENFSSLRVVQIDAPVETIRTNAFANCHNLEFVFFSREVTCIEYDAFPHDLSEEELTYYYPGSQREWALATVDDARIRETVFIRGTMDAYFEYDVEYLLGEAIRARVIVQREDGREYIVDSCSVLEYDKDRIGEQNIVLRFGPFVEMASIWVNEDGNTGVLGEIRIENVKTEYYIGEEFYAEVYVYTDDGICYQVEDFIVEGFDSNIPGEQEVTVIYNDYYERVIITVLEPEKEYEIVFENVKTEYELGEEFYIEVYECTDDERISVPLSDCIIEGFDCWSVGDQFVTVWYGDYMETFGVVVYDKPVVEEGVNWTFDETTGELVISGNGEMSQNEDGTIPWKQYKNQTTIVTIRDGITSICTNAFEGCTLMQSIYIPASVTKIGDNAFLGCSKLTAVYYGGSYSDWKMIETGAGNTHLTAVKITYNSTGERNIVMECTQYDYLVGDRCFYINVYEEDSNGNLMPVTEDKYSVSGFDTTTAGTRTVTVSYGGHSETFEITVSNRDNLTWSFDNTTKELIIDGYGDMGEYDSWFEYGTGYNTAPWYSCLSQVKTITIGDNVTSISSSAFLCAKQLTTIHFGKNIQKIDVYAFQYCSALKEVTIPDTVTLLNGTFWNCTGLETVHFGKNVVEIKGSAFYSCKLKNVVLPDSVTTVGYGAFQNCSELTEIYIPASVTQIGNYTFYGCSALSDVYYGGTQEEWNAVSVGTNNECLYNATIHYANDEGEKPGNPEPTYEIRFENVKTEYEYGEEFYAEVYVYTIDGDSYQAEAYTVEGFDSTKPGNQTVTLRYEGEDGITYTQTYEVVVYEKDDTNPSVNGDGTEENPYLIKTEADLFAIANKEFENALSSCYVLQNNITLTSSWTPLETFTGSFDGNGYTIFAINIVDKRNYTGFFGQNQGTIKNLTVYSTISTTDAYNYYGGLVGYNTGTIINCHAVVNLNVSCSCNVNHNIRVGGLAGENHGTIKNCSVTQSNITTSGTGRFAAPETGGIAGWNYYDSIISSCYFSGAVTGDMTGGITGWNFELIERCHSDGSVTNSDDAGGITGHNSGDIKECYSNCTVSGESYAGGLVGLERGGSIYHCYATGSVESPSKAGGLTGNSSATENTTSSYYNSETCGCPIGGVATPLTTKEMKTMSSYENWDFENVWAISPTVNNGYPYLRESTTEEEGGNDEGEGSNEEVTFENVKTKYEYGEDFYAEVYVYCADGTRYQVEDYEVEGFDSCTPGEQTVTVTYHNYSQTFKVTVSEQVIVEPENAPVVSVSTTNCMAGNTVDVVVSVSNNTGFVNLGIEIEYHRALTLVGVTANSGVGATFTPAQTLNVYPYNILFNAIAGTDYNGELVTLTFEVPKGTQAGDYYVDVNFYRGRDNNYTDGYDVNYDINSNPLGLRYENGSISVYDYIPGDINGDGVVNNKDGTCLLQYLAGWELENIVEEALDTDGNGSVNSKDGTRLLCYLAGWDVEIY